MGRDMSRKDILEIERRILKLIFDVHEKPKYRAEVNRIFSDLFGVDRVANAFIGVGGMHARDIRIRLYDTATPERLFDMMVAENRDGTCDFSIIQIMVKLLSNISSENRSRLSKDDKAAYYEKYEDLLNILKESYEIKTIASIDSMSNPLKMAKKVIKGRYDGYGYDDYDDYDYSYSRRFKSVSSYDDDDYDDSYFNRIIRGTDFERERPRSKKNSHKTKKYENSYDDDYDDSDDATPATDGIIADMADQLKTVADAVLKLQKKVDTPKPNVVESPAPTPIPYNGYHDNSELDAKLKKVYAAINVLSKSVKSNKESIDGIADHVEMIETDLYESDSGDGDIESGNAVDIDSFILNASGETDTESNDDSENVT